MIAKVRFRCDACPKQCDIDNTSKNYSGVLRLLEAQRWSIVSTNGAVLHFCEECRPAADKALAGGSF